MSHQIYTKEGNLSDPMVGFYEALLDQPYYSLIGESVPLIYMLPEL